MVIHLGNNIKERHIKIETQIISYVKESIKHKFTSSQNILNINVISRNLKSLIEIIDKIKDADIQREYLLKLKEIIDQ